ncbi:hypothetical protein [Thermanaerothrix daxensis]|nr:hypothetical protein [Thermanaerothrix daxensis]
MKFTRLSTPSISTLTKAQATLLVMLATLVLTVLFASIPLPGGDDWEVFRAAVQRTIHRQTIYGVKLGTLQTNYYYPPWVLVLLLIPGLLPFNWGLALTRALSLILAVVIAWRFRTSLIKQILALLSPPMLYIMLHGQVDVLILAIMIFLPPSWWLIGSITKPQVTLAFLFGIPRKDWLRAVLIAAMVGLVSFLIFGPWPLALLNQPRGIIYLGHNIWGGLWPYNVPIGLALVFFATQKQDLRFIVAASPFFMPYAAMSSLIGPWITLSNLLEDWQAAVVLIAWWAASFYRFLF